MAASLTAVLAQLEAQVTLDTRGAGVDGTASSGGVTLTNLDTVVTSSDPNFFDVSGGLTASDMNVSEFFSVSITGVSDWNFAAAAGAADKSVYIDGLTSSFIDGGNSGFGVAHGTDPKRLDSAGGAFVIEFDLGGLTVGTHSSDFVLQGLTLSKWDDGVDAYDYMVLNTTTDTVTASATGGGDVSLVDLGISIGDGDVLVVAFNSGDFQFDQFTVDVVPEPSAYALIGGLLALGSVMLRRRR